MRGNWKQKRRCAQAVILCTGMAGMIVAATNQKALDVNSTAADNPGWEQHAKEAVSLDWYVNYSWFVTPWGENAVSQKITEETGVDVNFITPMGNEDEKLNALIASDSLPDLITIGWWEPQVGEMLDKDMIYSLNELADQYDTYFWKVTNPMVVNWYTKEDGNIYYYPNSPYTPEDVAEHNNIGSNQTFLVRKDIYEAIGSPDMTTTEGFQAAVEKAAQMYPMVDGQPLIPVGAHTFDDTGCVSFDKYLQNFLAIPFEKDGEAYDRYTDPEYLRWLKMFRQLGEEGYLSSDIFIDQRTQMEEKLANGRYFCMLFQRTDVADQQKKLYTKDPDSIYIAVDGPKNIDGSDYALPTTGINGWTITMISKNCEHPDRAIEFLDYLMSEHGQMMTYLGVEEVTYDMVNGSPVVRQKVQSLLNSDRDAYDALYGADDTYWMMQNNVMQLQWKQPLTEPTGQLEEWTYPYVEYLGQYDTFMPENTDIGNASTKVNKLWSETLPRLLLASSDEEFDQIIAEFEEKRDELGFTKIQQEKTRQMEEAKEKLGLE